MDECPDCPFYPPNKCETCHPEIAQADEDAAREYNQRIRAMGGGGSSGGARKKKRRRGGGTKKKGRTPSVSPALIADFNANLVAYGLKEIDEARIRLYLQKSGRNIEAAINLYLDEQRGELMFKTKGKH